MGRVELGYTLFAFDVDEVEACMDEGAGNVLFFQDDASTSMLCAILKFTRVCVSTIDDSVA